MPILASIAMIFLAFVAVTYSMNRYKRKYYSEGASQFNVNKLLALAYLPVFLWLTISTIFIRPFLGEGQWLLMTVVIGLTWVFIVYIKFFNAHPPR